MPITLSDKIENAPKGSRLRNLFDDSSDDGSFGVLSAVDDSQKSQATWVGTQAPPTIQTQPEPYIIPRKRGYTEQKSVDERCPTPKPKKRPIEIADTPAGTASPTQTFAASDNDATQDDRLVSSMCGDLEPLKQQLENGEQVQSRRPVPARVSLSPSVGKSRTNVSNISSLEALHPPQPPTSRARRVTEKKQSKREHESGVMDVENTNFEQQLTASSINSKPKAAAVPDLEIAAMNNKTDSPKDAIAKEPPKKKTKKQSKKSSEEKKAASDVFKPSPIEDSKTSKKRKQITTVTKEDDDSSFGTDNISGVLSTESANRKEMVALDKVNTKSPTVVLDSPAVATTIQTNAGPSAPVPVKAKKKRTFQDQVLAEMFFSCKAYNLKTLANSLNTTEVALQYLMLSLLDKKIVIKKEFTSKTGKTKDLYWANQESKAKEVMKLIPDQQEMEEAQSELSALRRLDTEIAKEMTIIHQELSNDEIHSQLREMELKVIEVKDKVTSLRTSIKKSKECKQLPLGRSLIQKTPAQLVKENCPRRTALRINAMRDEWKSRKQKCMDFVEQLADGMEKKPKDVIKVLEIETDEMERVVMPPKRVVETSGK